MIIFAFADVGIFKVDVAIADDLATTIVVLDLTPATAGSAV